MSKRQFPKSRHYRGNGLKTRGLYEADTQELNLKGFSLSIFRNSPTNSLEDAIKFFEHSSVNFLPQARGIGREKGHAVSQLRAREIQWNEPNLGRVALKQAINAIYERVPSVRKKLSVKTDSVELLGYWPQPNRSVAITFNECSAEQLIEERSNILDTLEELGEDLGNEFRWLKPTPHLALGKVNIHLGQSAVDCMIDNLKELIPEQLVLDRATFYKA